MLYLIKTKKRLLLFNYKMKFFLMLPEQKLNHDKKQQLLRKKITYLHLATQTTKNKKSVFIQIIICFNLLCKKKIQSIFKGRKITFVIGQLHTKHACIICKLSLCKKYTDCNIHVNRNMSHNYVTIMPGNPSRNSSFFSKSLK